MKKYFRSLYLNPSFLGFVFFFAYVYSVQGRMAIRGQINIYTFTPDGPVSLFIRALIIFFITGFIIKKYTKSGFSFSDILRVSLVSLGLYLFFQNVFSYLVALVFNTVDRNFNKGTLLLANTDYLLDFAIFGAFFMAHYYYQKSKENNARMADYDKALAETKIESLKAQLNPHFLFNNLNVLDQLIEEDRKEASAYLNDFAELYRYILETSDKKVVEFEDELGFATGYFKLIQHKYGDAYRLQVSGNTSIAFLPPLSIQLLLENAIEHNLGTPDNPIKIAIEITPDKVVVSNTVRAKKSWKKSGGRALKNLKSQYSLLSDQLPEIKHEPEMFTVSLPLLNTSVK